MNNLQGQKVSPATGGRRVILLSWLCDLTFQVPDFGQENTQYQHLKRLWLKIGGRWSLAVTEKNPQHELNCVKGLDAFQPHQSCSLGLMEFHQGKAPYVTIDDRLKKFGFRKSICALSGQLWAGCLPSTCSSVFTKGRNEKSAAAAFSATANAIALDTNWKCNFFILPVQTFAGAEKLSLSKDVTRGTKSHSGGLTFTEHCQRLNIPLLNLLSLSLHSHYNCFLVSWTEVSCLSIFTPIYSPLYI